MVIGDQIALIGAGGAAKDILCQLADAWKVKGINYRGRVVFTEPDSIWQKRTLMNCPVIAQSDFDPINYHAIIAIGDSQTRSRVFPQLPSNTRYGTIIHPSAVVSEWVEMGEGAVVSMGSVLTALIKIGDHCQINYHTSIGHDFTGGHFFSTGPGANINGNCQAGDRVYIGSNAALRQGVSIGDDVTIGMGAVVLNSIPNAGVYAGIPAVRFSNS